MQLFGSFVRHVGQKQHAKRRDARWFSKSKLLLASSFAMLVVACNGSGAEIPDDGVASSRQALSQKITLSVTLPSGAEFHNQALGTWDSMTLADGVTVKDRAGNWAQVSNAGAQILDVGSTTQVGAVWSLGPVNMRSNAVVNGFVTTSQTLTRQAGARVTGAIQENATLTPLNVLPWAVTLPDVGSNVGLEPNTSRSLDWSRHIRRSRSIRSSVGT